MTARRVGRTGLAAVVLAAGPSVLAAQQQFVGVSYMWSLPTGDAKSFTNNDSWLGFDINAHRFINPDRTIAVGSIIGWNELYWKTSETIDFTFAQHGAGSVQSLQYRDFNIYPFLVGADYYFHLHGKPALQPYVGAYLGVYYIRQTFDISTVEFTTFNWIFGWAPEAGIRLLQRSGGSVYLFARYHWPVNAGQFLPNNIAQSIRYLSIGVGFGFGR